jgi:hypothetical protein
LNPSLHQSFVEPQVGPAIRLPATPHATVSNPEPWSEHWQRLPTPVQPLRVAASLPYQAQALPVPKSDSETCTPSPSQPQAESPSPSLSQIATGSGGVPVKSPLAVKGGQLRDAAGSSGGQESESHNRGDHDVRISDSPSHLSPNTSQPLAKDELLYVALFSKPQRALASGQVLVFYTDSENDSAAAAAAATTFMAPSKHAPNRPRAAAVSTADSGVSSRCSENRDGIVPGAVTETHSALESVAGAFSGTTNACVAAGVPVRTAEHGRGGLICLGGGAMHCPGPSLWDCYVVTPPSTSERFE